MVMLKDWSTSCVLGPELSRLFLQQLLTHDAFARKSGGCCYNFKDNRWTDFVQRSGSSSIYGPVDRISSNLLALYFHFRLTDFS